MASDILERAKSLRHYLANKAEWQDESVIVGELISEVERLRSEREVWIKHYNDVLEANARIKELEAILAEIEEDGDCLTVAYLLGGKKKADENRVLIAYVKRLEAAFLESEAAMLFYRGTRYPVWPDIGAHAEVYRQKAREALEEIKTGGKDE